MKIGPFTIEERLSPTSILAVAMAFVALVGGWYRFDYRVSTVETQVAMLQANAKAEAELRQKETSVLEKIQQALEDRHIHVVKGGGEQ